nr:MAG TPA: hypothetical protein [Caudoviricetes sp.]
MIIKKQLKQAIFRSNNFSFVFHYSFESSRAHQRNPAGTCRSCGVFFVYITHIITHFSKSRFYKLLKTSCTFAVI